MPTKRLFCPAVLALIVLFSESFGEVIELEGTVKAVDVSGRIVNIERKTAKGSKILELEVIRKAGDLSRLEIGDSISVEYDQDLELVTKIQGAEEGNKAATEYEETGCQLSVTISDTGNVRVATRRPGKDLGRADDKPISRTLREDGSWDLLYGFGKSGVLSSFGYKQNTVVDTVTKSLVMKPAPSAKGNYLSAGIAPKGRFSVPITVEIDVAERTGNAMLRLELNGGNTSSYGQHLFFLRSNDGFRKTAVVGASTGQGEKAAKHFEETVPLDEPFAKSFRLPIPNIQNQDVYTVLLGAFYDGSLRIRRLSIHGYPVPTFGIGLDQQADNVFAKKLLPDGIAKKAGLKEGDVLLAINGERPTSLNDAVQKMMAVGFDEKLGLVVRRGDQEKRFELKAEWDE